jgi:hypothetical protein
VISAGRGSYKEICKEYDLGSTTRCTKWSSPLRVHNQNVVCISYFSSIQAKNYEFLVLVPERREKITT